MSTEPKVRFKKIGNFSGPYIKGTKSAFKRKPTLDSPHIERAFWLTSMVECGGKVGSIMMADGTGVTASLEQLVAVYPRALEAQGPLFKMLRRLDYVVPVSYYLPFNTHGWTLGNDGVLRDIENGKPIDPKKIRNVFTPIGGAVEKDGVAWNHAKVWAIAFHQVFSLDPTIAVQIKYGIEQFVKFGQRVRSSKLGGKTVEELAYKEIENPSSFTDVIGGEVNDLAMCMWWCYKVNGPSPAMRVLKKVFDKYDRFGPFGAALIRGLRSSSYGRFGTNRYDNTRAAAMKIWPSELFEGPNAVMPERQK